MTSAVPSHDVYFLSGDPSPHHGRWWSWTVLALLLAGLGIVLFLAFVASPSVGAAGGCGGG